MQLKQRLLIVRQPEIGKLVREIRQEMRLTQEKFASGIGVTFTTLNRWENGRAKPSPLAVQQIEGLLHQLGDRGQSLLTQYFAEIE